MTTDQRLPPAWEWMGIEVVSLGDGAAVLEMPAVERMGNPQGTVHGGFISLLADSAMGRSLATVMPEGGRHFSFDLKLSFISAARAGDRLRASARVLHAGRRTGVAECRVESSESRLVATATASFMLYRSGDKEASDAAGGDSGEGLRPADVRGEAPHAN